VRSRGVTTTAAAGLRRRQSQSLEVRLAGVLGAFGALGRRQYAIGVDFSFERSRNASRAFRVRLGRSSVGVCAHDVLTAI
jgi:hypothetical protein